MDWIAAVVVGAAIGWIASLLMQTENDQGPLANIIIGVLGGVIGKFVFSDMLGIGPVDTTNSIMLMGALWAIIGAIILIGILKSFKVLT